MAGDLVFVIEPGLMEQLSWVRIGTGDKGLTLSTGESPRVLEQRVDAL